MFEESVSSSPTFWSSITSWFTPTIFFLLLQLVIATIYIISSLSNNNNNNNATHKHHQHEQQDHHETNHFQQQPLARSPSLLHRLKSINFYTYYPHHTHETQQPQQYHQHHQHEQYPHETNDFQQQPLARSPSLLQRLKSINFYSYYPHHTNETQQPQHHHHHHQQQQQPPQQKQPQLARSPSSVLQRLKSINLHTYFPTEPFSSYFTHEKTLEQPEKKTFVPKTPVLETEQKHKEEDEEEEQEDDDDDVVGEMFQNNNHELHHDDEGSGASLDEIFSKLQQGQGGNFTRSHSDTKPESGEVPVRLPRKMKKSASTKSAFSHFEEGDIVESHRPATAREGGAAVDDGDGGVDAKADDFINRFKQQLKLQRLDSIMRYKEMIGRGSGN